MSYFKIGEVEVEDTFAEAFPMAAVRILITAEDEYWARTAAQVATGFASSIIMSPAEAGVEGVVDKDKTPDGRVGALIQIYHRTLPELKMQVLARLGQCILTCPTAYAFDGLPEVKRKLHIGSAIGKFGDGFETFETIYGKKMVRIPVMQGWFLVEETVGMVKGVAGGNIIIMGEDERSTLQAAMKAVEAIRNKCKKVILPFPGGIVRSGSKVGSLKYPKLPASTNHPLCPTIKDKVKDSMVPEGVNSILEIVINGITAEAVKIAQGVGILAAAKIRGVKRITAVNFGGKLGPYKIFNKEAVEAARNVVGEV
ncbi:MAG: formylmethanofuran--tetrahydromethanopterin N-formyltransferase [Candidatus Bathyarchaeota archaeon]